MVPSLRPHLTALWLVGLTLVVSVSLHVLADWLPDAPAPPPVERPVMVFAAVATAAPSRGGQQIEMPSVAAAIKTWARTRHDAALAEAPRDDVAPYAAMLADSYVKVIRAD